MSNLSILAACQALDIEDQELPKATGQHVLCSLVSITNVEHQQLALESSVSASGCPLVMHNFDILD